MKKLVVVFVMSMLVLGTAYTFLSPLNEQAPGVTNPAFRVLVFSKTKGYRHASIEPGQQALQKMAQEHGFEVDLTEDAGAFTADNLQQYAVVIFLNTTGDVLDDEQQENFEHYIQAGGGYVGIHSAADTEYDWAWYGRLAGGFFNGHPNNPNVRDAVVEVVDPTHVSTSMLPNPWRRADEWYDYKSFNTDVHVLLKVDEKSYRDEVQSEDHPIAWYHAFDGGRAFYTAMGHTEASFSEPLYLAHLWGGIQYAAGQVDMGQADGPPNEALFTKIVYDSNFNEPMELERLDDGRLLFVERHGAVKIYDPEKGGTSETIAQFKVFDGLEEGLLGVALDPDYASNHWVYFSYSAPDVPEIRVARFVLEGSTLDMNSEKVLLRIPVQREQCCHVAGSMEFDGHGNLYIAIGDNSNPFASDGYDPIDEREGRSPWDAQKSAGNSNDLRGNILRIKPEPDGTYSIPDGNLFPKDGSVGRPEIYVKGDRNPFRMSIDNHTGYLYWGEVGPDAGENAEERGPKGHDEINQARGPGYFGWPYFVGDNKPYRDYDYATGVSGDYFDPKAPVNDSPNNTGARTLPPAQPAFIWYPYDESEEFPLVGVGGRNAMAGPVYYVDDYEKTDHTFPAYYDGKLFIYDWMRGWIMAVTMDENGDYESMERFMPSTEFDNPIDMLFGPDGTLYVLEYGKTWNHQNLDARLSRIEYAASNRAPVAHAVADHAIGAAPLRVAFSAAPSIDPDGDQLSYAWTFGEDADVQSTDAEVVHTFDQPGTYQVRLMVTDSEGLSATDEMEVMVGNDVPEVAIDIKGNRTFFWDNASFDYKVIVEDTEDGSLAGGDIAPGSVTLTSDYLAEGQDLTIQAQGHQAAMESAAVLVGKTLIEGSDCLACHQPNAASIGPSYTAVAQKYAGDEQAPAYLVDKIIRGGGGVWGDQAMAAHPQLTKDEVGKMVTYILSLDKAATPGQTLPLQGTFTMTEHVGTGEQGRYIISASYTDQGHGAIGPLTGNALVTLRHPRVQAENYDATDKATTYNIPKGAIGLEEETKVAVGVNQSYIVFKSIDLTDVKSIEAFIGMQPGATIGGRVELHLDRPDGEQVGMITLPPETAGFQSYTTALSQATGVHDLVLAFVNNDRPDATDPVCAVDWLFFHSVFEN